MKDNILYYPTIDIPNENWLRNAIIYWDEVSSIVPMDIDNQSLIPINPNIQFLKDEGIFRPIRPEKLIYEGGWDVLERFNSEFINSLDDYMDSFNRRMPKYSRIHNRKISRATKIHQDKIRQPENYKVHNNKISMNLLDVLDDRDLINKESRDNEWIEMNSDVALIYMSILAKYLAEIDNERTTVGTDTEIFENINFINAKIENRKISFESSLDNILPTPRANVPFETIVNFKKQRKDELLRFRNEIQDFEKKLSEAEDISEMKDIIITFSRSVELGVNDLEKCFKDARISTYAKSLKSLISVKSPTLLSSLLVYSGKATQIANIPVGLTIAGLSVMGSIELVCSYINSRNENIAQSRDSSFSYLYYGRKKGIFR